jgi:hypothetical protein
MSKNGQSDRNEELYDRALEAISELYSDRRVSKNKCRENMKELAGEIECMIESLDCEVEE